MNSKTGSSLCLHVFSLTRSFTGLAGPLWFTNGFRFSHKIRELSHDAGPAGSPKFTKGVPFSSEIRELATDQDLAAPHNEGAVALKSAVALIFLNFFESCPDVYSDEVIENTGFHQKIKTSASIEKRRFVVKYLYEIRKYFTSKLYVVFAVISTKTSNRNRTNYS